LTGTELWSRRLLAGLTRRALAGELGVDERTILRWEKEEYPIPRKRIEGILEFFAAPRVQQVGPA
jgi:transcriptional regulator with XRE-family HTH domain